VSNPNVSLVQSLYAAFGRDDVATITAALAPNVDWTVNGRNSDYPVFGNWKTPAQVQDFFKLVAEYEGFTDFSPRDFHAVDDKVFVLGHYAGLIKKTGKPFASDWIHVFTIHNGKVLSFREFNDSHQFVAAYRG
jgi:ketosteroid isomerase-like protein